jgi:hypothetical protein
VPRKISSKLQFIILKDFVFSFQEYSVQITFRQQWNDNRLAFNNMDGEYYISRSPQHECTKLRFDKISFNDNLVTVLTIHTIPYGIIESKTANGLSLCICNTCIFVTKRNLLYLHLGGMWQTRKENEPTQGPLLPRTVQRTKLN